MKAKAAFVGVPCQIQALRKVNTFLGEFREVVSIGIFCRENWSYSCMRALVENDLGIPLANVQKFDIKRGKFIIEHDGVQKEIPLHDTRNYVRINCHICLDFVGELADISVGSVGSPQGWSTVITKTKLGSEIVKGAEKAGYIELAPPSKVGLINKISHEKKQENRDEADRREMKGIEMQHVKTMHEREIEKFLEGAKNKQFSNLEFDVIDVGSCTSCGACAAVCPIDIVRFKEERPYIIDKCKKGCSSCYVACPRTFLPLPAIEERIDFENKEKDQLLGHYTSIYAAKAKKDIKGQDGGAVTAILMYMLDSKIVDKALTVEKGSRPWEPKPAIVSSSGELLKTAGTIYSMATTMQELRRV